MKTVLTIAGSDCSGGAGIQADIKTMTVNGVYAMSVVTALTAQNTTGVEGIKEVDNEFLELQLDCVFSDVFPDAVKTGMLPSKAVIKATAKKLYDYKAKNIVVDPVMVSGSGTNLMDNEAIHTLKTELFPLASMITPNIPEAKVLTGQRIETAQDMIRAAEVLYKNYGCAVLIKGGHRARDANDLLYLNHEVKWFYGKRINNHSTHGTGCTLSSAIAANLAKGYSAQESVLLAKKYISGALNAFLDLGKGAKLLNHSYQFSVPTHL